MDDEQMDWGDATPSEERPVLVRACDMCRKKKIRCEPKDDQCVQCIKYKTYCHFTPISTKRKPRRPPGHKAITELEQRLKKMESLLKIALEKGAVEDLEGFSSKAKSNEHVNAGPGKESTAVATKRAVFNGLVDSGYSILVAPPPQNPAYQPYNALSYNGSSASPESQKPTSYTTCNPHAWNSMITPVFQELPPKEYARDLIDEAFVAFNSTFPLFNQADFLRQFEEKYLTSSPSDPEWWACINVTLGMAHRFRAMRLLDEQQETHRGCLYIRNGLGVLAQLSMMKSSLAAVQALLGLTILLQGTSDSATCDVIMATTMRLAHSMGMHRRDEDVHFSPDEVEQRRRVFWLAYMLDKDISFRTRKPASQDDEDMDVDLPATIMSQLYVSDYEFCTISFFNTRIGLAIIQGQIYKKLLSTQASQLPAEQLAMTAQDLDDILAFWKSGVPLEFSDNFLTNLESPISEDNMHMIILRVTYVSCLIRIHRFMCPTQRPTEPDGFPRHPDNVCLLESRKAMKLVSVIPHGDYACVWLLIDHFYAAVKFLLASIVFDPERPEAQPDILAVEPFFQLLASLASGNPPDSIRTMILDCESLRRKASNAVQSVSAEIFI